MGTLRKTLILLLLLIQALNYAGAQNYNEQIQAFQQSYIEEASGNTTKSIEELKKVYSEDSYEINLRLGYLCFVAGRFTESIAYYSRAIDLMPYSLEAKFGYVMPAAAIGNYTMVIKQYNKILEIAPNNSIAYHRLGLIYYGKEDFQAAEKYFEKVVNLYPFDYDGLTMLAWTKLKLNKTSEAKILFYKALLHTPGGTSAMEGLELVK